MSNFEWQNVTIPYYVTQVKKDELLEIGRWLRRLYVPRRNKFGIVANVFIVEKNSLTNWLCAVFSRLLSMTSQRF